jgi:hypothetical protein
MRLRLFDRIRRLVPSRRSAGEKAPGISGAQGRHRHGRQRGPAAPSGPPPASPGPAPASPGFPGGPDPARGQAPAPPGRPGAGRPPAELAHTAAPWPGGSPPAEASFTPGAAPGPGEVAGPRPHRGTGSRRAAGPAAMRVGAARARIREAPPEAASPVAAAPGPARGQVLAEPGLADAEARAAEAQAAELARVAAGVPRQPDGFGRGSWRPAVPVAQAGLPFAASHSRERPRGADGRRHCGSLEAILWRQWDPASPPPREVVTAVDRLAELPVRIKEKLADGLDAIFIGPGGVPELDDMTGLRGVSLPSGRATWDACAGAYGERKIVVGSRPSPTPDVMCHEVGHALDDIDGPPGKWQSDSPEFRMLYDQCQPHFASDFHRQPGGLGRKEFFADAFAAIASRQRPALVDMLSGDTRTALRVMLYFNRRYGI